MNNNIKEQFNKECRICGSVDWSILYKGPIRMGKFGDCSTSDHVIWKCNQCKAGFLDRPSFDYELPDYRSKVDGDSSPEHFYSIHDKEQSDNLRILGTANLRGKVIADIGCGAGSFLDLIKGYAAKTIAIEPALSFQKELQKKGHHVYQYCDDAVNDYKGQVDMAVSFAVIEHIDNPLKFLKDIKSLLKPEGFLLLSTPNYDDWLIDFLPEVYAPFFFRYAHTVYFNGDSLKELVYRAGFSKIKIEYIQRFDISNALYWIRDQKATGNGKMELLQDIDDSYKRILRRKGKTDFIFSFIWI